MMIDTLGTTKESLSSSFLPIFTSLTHAGIKEVSSWRLSGTLFHLA